MRDDPIPLHYDPTPLGAIRHGISAAVARQVLTHRDTPKGGWKLDGLIRAAGAEATRRNRQLVRQDQETLEGAGVLIVGDRVFQNEKVAGRTLLGRDRTLLGRACRSLLGVSSRRLLGRSQGRGLAPLLGFRTLRIVDFKILTSICRAFSRPGKPKPPAT